ncbi:MAG TPA: hypothetical protein VFP58_06930 [Candidatus Eisenbacteria bacterium]|nr:hypothetical protein [Candidatus Eisenbacteria bacterium]
MAALCPGSTDVAAQIVISSRIELNLSQESQEVGWSPGKKVCAEWMESEEQPETRQARTSSSRGITALLSGVADPVHVGNGIR